MATLLAGLCGVLIVGGLVLFAAGLRRRPRSPPRYPQVCGKRLWIQALAVQYDDDGGSWRSRSQRASSPRAVVGWPLLAVLVPVVAYGLPMVLSAPSNRDLAVLEALDRWVRSLASLLPTGRSISDAIRVSVGQAPALLAPHLRLLTARLDDRWTTAQALLSLADELDSPDADAVLAALSLAADRGGTGATATLAALADNIQDRLRALREIETERAKPRIVVRQVTLITLVVLGLALLFGGSFFAPYGSPLGQLLLAALVFAYLGALLFLRRLTLPRPRQRILRRLA